MTGPESHKLHPESWLENHGDYLYSYAMTRLNSPDKAEDFMQETFLAALASRESFRGQSSERTWLVSILKRKIIDHYRKQFRNKQSSIEDLANNIYDPDSFRPEHPFQGHWQEGRGPHSAYLLPEGRLEEKELAELIRLCLEHLPAPLASVFILKLIDEEDSASICKEMGITTSNLWVMLHRSRLRMRKCLEQHWLEKK